ncbi:hypothetical protein SKAU_G00160180 [Synaphobranchus kaupii]|uniref:Uncharacterized protein n=1 Tax=Synaphobranchus kaupii TaxID=118154 RepID=A0A9Q1IZC0_SYNKA|nr:hypothetical protein SKAU_G00160180 [Synaphobranchus kaupii]
MEVALEVSHFGHEARSDGSSMASTHHVSEIPALMFTSESCSSACAGIQKRTLWFNKALVTVLKPFAARPWKTGVRDLIERPIPLPPSLQGPFASSCSGIHPTGLIAGATGRRGSKGLSQRPEHITPNDPLTA